MKKKMLWGIVSLVVISSVGTVFAYNVLPYSKSNGKVIVCEQNGHHKMKTFDMDQISQIRGDYQTEIAAIDSSSSLTEKKVALENAEKILESLKEELYDQEVVTKRDEQKKQEQEVFIKQQYVELGNIRNELFPVNEKEEMLNQANYLKEQVLFEKSFYQDSDDAVASKMLPILNKIQKESDKLYEDVKNDVINSMDEFNSQRDKIFILRTELENEAGLEHLGKDEI